MRALLQRVTFASVNIDGATIAEIGPGAAILLGIASSDDDAAAAWLAAKIASLRIFEDRAGAMNLSLVDTSGSALVVPQFTLCGDTRRGRRPSFSEAAPPDIAEPLFERFCDHVAARGLLVARGKFRAHMLVTIHNDGPVTLMLDTDLSRRGNPKV
ncbi:MAG: D-aminoacyl-tRNA deacylase [Anaerolineae bacterium]